MVLKTHINKSFDVSWALPFLPEMVLLQLTCLSVSSLSAQLSGSALSWAGWDHHLLHLRDQHRHSTFRILRNASYHWPILNKLLTTTSILLWAIDCEIKNSVFTPSKFHFAIFGPGSKKKKKKRYQYGHLIHLFIHSFSHSITCVFQFYAFNKCNYSILYMFIQLLFFCKSLKNMSERTEPYHITRNTSLKNDWLLH